MNKLNENGERHGLWEKYHTNGKHHYKGEYINGKRNGLWTFYWWNNTPSYTGFFKDNAFIGYFVFHYNFAGLLINSKSFYL